MISIKFKEPQGAGAGDDPRLEFARPEMPCYLGSI